MCCVRMLETTRLPSLFSSCRALYFSLSTVCGEHVRSRRDRNFLQSAENRISSRVPGMMPLETS